MLLLPSSRSVLMIFDWCDCNFGRRRGVKYWLKHSFASIRWWRSKLVIADTGNANRCLSTCDHKWMDIGCRHETSKDFFLKSLKCVHVHVIREFVHGCFYYVSVCVCLCLTCFWIIYTRFFFLINFKSSSSNLFSELPGQPKEMQDSARTVILSKIP